MYPADATLENVMSPGLASYIYTFEPDPLYEAIAVRTADAQFDTALMLLRLTLICLTYVGETVVVVWYWYLPGVGGWIPGDGAPSGGATTPRRIAFSRRISPSTTT